jgi:hypothetical protein
MFALATHRRRSRGLLSWLLSYVLLAQALFPIQAHTQWVTDPEGMVVVVCTLQGERTAVIDEDPEDGNALDEYRSPACVFSSLLGSTVASAATLEPSPLFLATVSQDTLLWDLPGLGPDRTPAIRAPPGA